MADIKVVKNPPALNASVGSKDRPIITQKIASEPKPHARKTISYAMRRMSSIIHLPRCQNGPGDKRPAKRH